MRLGIVTGTAVILALGISVDLHADERFRIQVNQANVRSAPSTSSQVMAQVPRHVVLPVLAQSQGWVLVRISDAPGETRTGYIKATLGRIEQVADAVRLEQPDAITDRAVRSIGSPAGAAVPEGPRLGPATVASPPQVVASTSLPSSARPPTPHVPGRFGLGGRAGGFAIGFGGSARLWVSDRVGVETLVSRSGAGYSQDLGGIRAEAGAGILTIAPSVLYRFRQHDPDDDVTLRPYVGGGISITRTSLSTSASGFGESLSESSSTTNLGYQALGGLEIRFKDVARLGVSADIGYYSNAAPFAGISVGGVGIGFAAHWYLR